MRQLAFFQYLVGQGVEVDFFASISGPQWLESLIQERVGARWRRVPEGNFDPVLFSGHEYEALVIDSYHLDQGSLDLLQQKIPRVAVLIDGPWQDLRGQIAISPVLRTQAAWIRGYRRRFQNFYCGPGYFMLREEIVNLLDPSGEPPPRRLPRVVVSFGGTDLGNYTERVITALEKVDQLFHVDIFSGGWRELSFSPRNPGVTFTIQPPGANFAPNLAQATLAITAAGTTVAELIFLGVNGIYIPVVRNQKENARAIRKMKLGKLMLLPSLLLEKRLTLRVRRFLIDQKKNADPGRSAHQFIDQRGCSRVFEAIMNEANHQNVATGPKVR